MNFTQKTKPLQPAEAIIFVFSCGRSHILFTCCCEHTSRSRLFRRLKKFRLLLLCRNALDHFVHWRFPLLLFLNEVPHGRDINHFSITSFFVLHPTSRRLGVTCTLEYLPSFRFYSLEWCKSFLVPPF